MRFLQSGWIVGCLILAFSAGNASAGFTYWDPQGKGAGGPTSGTWENADWSTHASGSTPPTAWVENTAAFFAVGASSSTPAFSVTMNSTHTVAGIFNGDGSTPCNVTISGAGTMTMPASTLQGFYTASPCSTTINVPIAGSGATFVAENSGQLTLNGTNTYTGGTAIGFSGAAFNGTLSFNNSAA